MRKAVSVILCCALLLLATVLSASAQTIELTVWAMGEEAQKIGAMTAKFEQLNPDIRVKVQAIPWSAAHDKIITAVAGGTGPEFVEALEFYAKLFHDGITPVDSGGTDLFQEFARGTTPMYFSGPWMINLTYEQVPEITGKWTVALCPAKKTRTTFVGGCNFVIFRDSKNKEAAWRFIEFMNDHRTQLEWFKVSGSLPAVKKSWEDEELIGNPMMAVLREQLDDTKAPDNVPQWAQIEAAIQRRVQEACYGTKTAVDAAQPREKPVQSGILPSKHYRNRSDRSSVEMGPKLEVWHSQTRPGDLRDTSPQLARRSQMGHACNHNDGCLEGLGAQCTHISRRPSEHTIDSL